MSTPWAYKGTDPATTQQFQLSSYTVWPAAAVWLSLTVEENLIEAHLNTQPLADALGISKASVDNIRALATADEPTKQAFHTVAQTFKKIAALSLADGQDYPIDECMNMIMLAQNMTWVKQIAPQDPPVDAPTADA